MKSGEDSGGKYSKWQQTAETKKKRVKMTQRNKVRASSLKDMQNEHQEALKCHAINKITRKKQKLREKTVKRVTKEQNYKKKLK